MVDCFPAGRHVRYHSHTVGEAPSGIKGWSTVFLPGDTSGTTVTLWEKYCKLRVSVRLAHKPGCHLLS
nr:unnamed protein product [Callosobruchus analis]